jgi:ferredoxin
MRPITVQRTLVPPYRSRQAKLSSASDHADDEQENMVSVTLETANNSNTLHVQKGEILRTALLRRGTSPHNGRARLINCRGLGTCGTCAVEIDGVEGAMEPNQRNTKEQLRLNFPPHGSPNQSPNLRLACQVQVQGDITVRKRKGFWGQDSDELAEEYEAKLWFGDLEYIMDDKSPPKRN